MTSIIRLTEVDSTNSFLRSYVQRGEAMTVAVAEHQTAGRGQTGNTWESAPGENLLCSFLFTPPAEIRPAESFVINKAIALAVRDACQDFLSEEVTVKWPNDIYVGHRKLCGILIETEMTGKAITRVVAGIGVNVNQTEWSFNRTMSPMSPIPVSIKMLTGEATPLDTVLHALISHMQRRLSDYSVSDYRSHLFRREGFHLYEDSRGRFEARIHSIEPTGHLILETRDGTLRRYAFKEVSHLMTNH